VKLLKKLFVVLLAALVLTLPSFALAESDYEETLAVSVSPAQTATPELTATPATDTPATPQKVNWPEIAETIYEEIVFFALLRFAAAIAVLVAVSLINRQKKNTVQAKNTSVNAEQTDRRQYAPNETKQPPVRSKPVRKAVRSLLCWLAGILLALIVLLAMVFAAGYLDWVLCGNDGTGFVENNDMTCSATVTEYVDPVTREEYFDILINAPNGSVIQPIASDGSTFGQATVESDNVFLARVIQKGFLPNTPLESDTVQITPKIEVTLPNGEIVQPELSGTVRTVPVLELFVTNPTTDVIEIPEDQESIQIAGRVVVFEGYTPVYINDEQVYVDEAGNFDWTVYLTQPGGDANADETVTVEARLNNCKTARKTITVHRIPTESPVKEVISSDITEKGNGWVFDHGVLTITANGGFEAYFEEVNDKDRAKKYQNEPYMVNCIVIGKNVAEFSMFAYCEELYSTQIIVEEGNTHFAVMDGWLVNRKTNTLICAADLGHFEWVLSVRNMPDSVQYIGQDAFYPLNRVQQICMPNSVIGIGDNAFNNCGGLLSIELPLNLKRIGKSAFNYCTSMENVVFNSSVDTIEEYAFYACYNLQHMNLNDTRITQLNSNVLSLSGIKELVLPDTLQTIKRDAFHCCWYLESVTVCSDHIVINDGAFSECDQLKTILFTKGVPAWIGSRLFNETGKSADGKCFISDSMQAEGELIPYPTLLYTAAYANEWAPNGETEWNGYPIRQMSAKEAQSLPVRTESQAVVPAALSADNGYEAGNGWVFQDGTLLVTANGGLDDFTNNKLDENYQWRHTHFPDEVESIEIGKNVSEITPFASYVSWSFTPKEIRIETGNPYFVLENGWIFQKETGTLVGPGNLEKFQGPIILNNLPKDTRVIGTSAFDLACLPYWYNEPGRALIQRVDFPESLQTIGKDAFYDCDELQRLDLPANLTEIGESAFHGCRNLENIQFNSALRSIGKEAFNNCSDLTDINLENSQITELRDSVFYFCTALNTAMLPETLKTIETDAFDYCTSLQTLVFLSDAVTIQSGVFRDCIGVKDMIFTKGVPAKFEDALFGEEEKTLDGKGYISRLYDKNGTAIPYPTLYYTAAYANEWAPNGETEWNGYPIQQISQEELDEILAEARGEETPMVSASPAPTETPLAEAPTPDQTETKPSLAMVFVTILLLEIGILAIVLVVIAVSRSRKAKK